MIRGMTEAETMIDRAIVVAREIQRLEEATFADDGKDRSEGMEPGASGMPRLEGERSMRLVLSADPYCRVVL